MLAACAIYVLATPPLAPGPGCGGGGRTATEHGPGIATLRHSPVFKATEASRPAPAWSAPRDRYMVAQLLS
jgi:hypothetical protein